MSETTAKSNWIKLALAFTAVYLIWGSTYIGIKFAIETMPPFFMIAVRFTIAGTIMYAFLRLRGVERPSREHILPTFILGTLLLGIGGAGVVLAEKTLPTGLVSLLVATVPVYIVLLQWLRPGGTYPGVRVLAGLAVGVTGLIVLLGPEKLVNGSINLGGVACVLVASLAAACGALYSRQAVLPKSQQLTASMEMIFAGLVMFVVSVVSGEFTQLHTMHVTAKSLFALLYLIVFGSMVAFSAYVWLLREVNPARVSTYAYVNPVVAVFLGWLMVNEPVTMQTIAGATIVLSAVWLITQAPPKPKFERVPMLLVKTRETCAVES